jgi:hydrogenase expression/formation protein HypC
MSLAVPAKLVSRSGNQAVADLHGNRVEISTMLVPDAIPGDWVLIHAGFAIQRVSDDDVKQTWEVLKDMDRAASAVATGPSEPVPQKAEKRL